MGKKGRGLLLLGSGFLLGAVWVRGRGRAPDGRPSTAERLGELRIQREKERLRRAYEHQDRVRRDFTANVSHELKTPLTSISGYAEIIREGLVKSEDVGPFAGKIYEEAQRLITLVEDILNLSRLDEGAPPREEMVRVDLYRLCEEAIAALSKLIERHGVEHIAIGNGTASRETEQMAVELIRKAGGGVSYAMVNEAGASVYSASKLAAEEFPEFDVNLRSAVSIARRLQDPLAELVKIDPKSIGVGQYQHDMPQARLGEALDGVVEDCVNAVGVDVNTASAPLLTRVAGLNGTTAKNIVKYREDNGPFTTRKQILKVPKLGPKAFEQCAGFLRVPESKSPLDNTAVHPESYGAAEKLLALCGHGMADVRAGKLGDLKGELAAYGEEKAALECGVGVPTLRDVAAELMKPGRDPRDELPAPVLRTDVLDVKDLKPGMELKGTVRNVIDFGAFVDIGVHQDGLVHISQICNRFIKHPSEVLSVGDVVTVWVKEVDEKKKRISLTMRKDRL